MRVIWVSLLSALVLASCNEQQASAPAEAEPQVHMASLIATPDPAAGPPVPGWAVDLIGQPLASAYPNLFTDCIGWADQLIRYDGQPTGSKVSGWAWNSQAGQAFAHIVLVDNAGVIQGVGESGAPRPDVGQSRPEVTDVNVGYEATTNYSGGSVAVYGVDDVAKSACVMVGVRV
jgi:hypothetical protein